MSDPSAAGVGKLCAVGDPVVVRIVQPSLGERDLAGGVGTAPRLAEYIRAGVQHLVIGVLARSPQEVDTFMSTCREIIPELKRLTESPRTVS